MERRRAAEDGRAGEEPEEADEAQAVEAGDGGTGLVTAETRLSAMTASEEVSTRQEAGGREPVVGSDGKARLPATETG